MSQDVHIYVGHDAVSRLVEYCTRLPTQRFTLISDVNTYRALGERLETALKGAGLSVTNIVLDGNEIIADERYLMYVLVQAPPGDQVFLAVGSGTITDITRYISFRTRNPFISTPTAASVDGFLSTGAPLVIKGVKDTYKAQGPLAVFADIPTLMAAPQPLRAAGFGDVIGKITALADWRLGHLLWNEPYDAEIERRVRQAMADCADAVQDIASGSERGVRLLINALLETGLCMLAVGDSRPASGSEHHCSHYWEMQLLRENKPAILHGAKVGYATLLISRLYEEIRALTKDDVRRLVRDAEYPHRETQVSEIRQAFGIGAQEVIRINGPFLDMTEQQYRQLQQDIVENWPVILNIAESVLPMSRISELLDLAGAPTNWKTLGLEEHMIEPALWYGHYLRNRFTILKLYKMLGLDMRQIIRKDPS